MANPFGDDPVAVEESPFGDAPADPVSWGDAPVDAPAAPPGQVIGSLSPKSADILLGTPLVHRRSETDAPDSKFLPSAAASTTAGVLNPVASGVRNLMEGFLDEEGTLKPQEGMAGGIADQLGEVANKGVWDAVGADPRSTNTQAQFGRGVGMVASTLPAMLAGPMGLPAAVGQMTGGAAEQARFQTIQQMRAAGVTDEDAIEAAASKAEHEAAMKALPGLAAYMIGGKIFGSVAARIAGAEAGPAMRGLFGTGGAAVSNVTTGSVIRALEAEGKVPGQKPTWSERIEAAIPRIENLTADTLFAVFHGWGEYGKATGEIREAARQELLRRGAKEEELAPGTPPQGPVPAQEIQPLSMPGKDAEMLGLVPPPRATETLPEESDATPYTGPMIPPPDWNPAPPPATPEGDQLRAQADQTEAGGAPQTAEILRAKADATDKESAPPTPTPPIEETVDERHRPEVAYLNTLRANTDEQPEPQQEPPGTEEPAPPPQQSGTPVQENLFGDEPATGAEAGGEVPAAVEPGAVPEPQTETRTRGPKPEHVSLDALSLSDDVPQFKKGANAKGVVEPLAGTFDPTGVGPIQVWRRLDGRLEVISGRHRFDLAQRSGEKTIWAQVHDEAAGFNQRAAARLDAELNIRDGQGSTADYASYFRHSDTSEEDASARGLLGRAKGRAGFSIARGASEDVFALHQSGRLTDAQAEALATAAPGNDGAQQLGLRAILGGSSIADARNTVEAALAGSRDLPPAEQGDFFSNTGLEEQWKKQAQVASQHQRELREQISAVQGAAKKPEVARKLGVDVQDPEGVRKRVEALREELGRWEQWSKHSDLIAITRGEKPAALPPAPAAPPPEAKYFGATVQAIIDAQPQENRFGDRKVWLHPVYEEALRRGLVSDRADFDKQMAGAMQKGEVAMTRADFPPHMTAEGEERGRLERVHDQSAMQVGAETFHFAVSDSAASRERPKSDARGADVIPPEDMPFNLVAETAADIAKRRKLEEAEAAAREAKDAAEAKAQQERDQGTFFSLSNTPESPDNSFIRKVQEAANRAPSEADLDAAGKQPGTIEFERPDRPGVKMVVQNTKEALMRLADKYRAPSDASHLQRVADVVEPLRMGVKGVRVRVVRNEADVPERMRRTLQAGDLHEGLVDPDNGDIYILADNIRTPSRAAEVFAHEVVGHYGVERLVGDEDFQRIANAVMTRARGEAEAIGRLYVKDENRQPIPPEQWTPEQRALVAREYVAKLAERPQSNPSAWRRVLQIIRNALRKLGLVREWTDADIRNLVLRAAKVVEQGKPATMVGEGGRIFRAVRDLGEDVTGHSPYAEHIEREFERLVPDEGARRRIANYVQARMSGDDLPPLSAHERNLGENALTFFRQKQDFARRNGVFGAAQEAFEERTRANPNLSLPERIAAFSAEVNRLVTERANMRGPEPGGRGEKGPSSTKNATVDQERQDRGLPPAMEPARREFGTVWDEAMARIDRAAQIGQDLGFELVKKLIGFPSTPISDTDNAILLHRQITLQNAFDQVAAETAAAHERGDHAAAADGRIRTAVLSDELLRVYNVGKRAGTALGRGLNARKMLADENYTLANMEMRKRAANGGKPLTEPQQQELFAQHQEIKAKQKASDEATAKAEEGASDNAAKGALDEVVKKVNPGRKKPKAPAAPAEEEKQPAPKVSPTTQTWLERQAEAAAARIKERGPRVSLNVDPLDLADRVIVVAAKIAGGLRDFGAWASTALREWGAEYQPHLQEIWNRAHELVSNRASVEAFAAKARAKIADGATLADIRPYVRKVAEGIVRAGTTDLEPFLDQLHSFVQEVAPGTTRREAMDLFSGYGKFTPLSKDAIKVQLRDLSGQSQQTAKVLDMKAGEAPKKTGPERRTPSDRERAIIKEVERLKKLGGYKVVDPDSQLRTALGAIITRLKNTLKDLSIRMETGDRPPEGEDREAMRQRIRKEGEADNATAAQKAALEQLNQVEDLEASVKRVKETLAAVEEKPGMTEEERIQATKKALQRSIDELNRRLEEDDYAPKKKRAPAESPELDRMRAERKALRAEFEELRVLDEDYQRHRAEKREAELQRAINEVSKKLETGNFGPGAKKPGAEPSETAAALKEQLAALQKQLAKERRESNRPMLTEEQKQAREDERLLRAYMTRTAQRIYELDARNAFGDYSKPVRRVLKLDDAANKAQAELARAQQEFDKGLVEDRLKNRGTTERLLDEVAGLRRAAVLSGFHPIEKLFSAAHELNILAPIHEAIGAVISRLPVVSRVAERAPREGRGFVTEIEIKALAETLKNYGPDFWHYLYHGGTELDARLGPAHLYPFEWKELFGRFHGALKTTARRNEYTRSLEHRMVAASRAMENVNDPIVRMRLETEAYMDANKAIFMEDNRVVDAYKRALSRFRQINPDTGKVDTADKVMETGLRILFPVVRIPTNIVARTFEYSFGSVTGSLRLAKALRGGIENLPPEQADLIMQNLKRGSLGAAVLLIGFLNPGNVGGYYNGKRDRKDVKEGELRIFGWDVPKLLIHNPLLEQLQIGATIRRIADSKLHLSDHDTQGVMAGVKAAYLGVVKQTPFVDTTMRLLMGFRNHETLDQVTDKMMESIFVPALLREIAQHYDKDPVTGELVKRKPVGLLQTLATGIPGLRQDVPRAH